MLNGASRQFYGGGGWGGGPWGGGGWGRGGGWGGPGWRGGRWGAPYGGLGWGGWYGRPYGRRMMYRRGYGYGCCCPVVLFALMLPFVAAFAGSAALMRKGWSRRHVAQG
jgi:hypothetical protein